MIIKIDGEKIHCGIPVIDENLRIKMLELDAVDSLNCLTFRVSDIVDAEIKVNSETFTPIKLLVLQIKRIDEYGRKILVEVGRKPDKSLGLHEDAWVFGVITRRVKN